MAFSLENEHYLKIKQLFASYPHLIASDFEDRIKQSIRVLHFEYLWGACREAQIIANKNQNINLFDLIMSLYNKRRESHQAKFLLLHCFENALRSTMAVITANAFNQTQDDFFALKIPLLPLDEQRRIAEFLDKKCEKIDKAIALIEREIQAIKEYKTSLIDKAVRGQI